MSSSVETVSLIWLQYTRSARGIDSRYVLGEAEVSWISWPWCLDLDLDWALVLNFDLRLLDLTASGQTSTVADVVDGAGWRLFTIMLEMDLLESFRCCLRCVGRFGFVSGSCVVKVFHGEAFPMANPWFPVVYAKSQTAVVALRHSAISKRSSSLGLKVAGILFRSFLCKT